MLFLLALHLLTFERALAEKDGPKLPLQYCVASNIDFNPFRKLEDGKELTYLLALTRSWISTDHAEHGIFKAYQFSPDGKTLHVKIDDRARWLDGEPISVEDAALSIAKGLTWRPLGSRLRVKGTQKINESGWESRNYSGIHYINKYEFKLEFETEIDNATGVIREALSTSSRHNRIWPVRLSRQNYHNEFDLVSIYPVSRSNGNFVMEIANAKIVLTSLASCGQDDFFIYPELEKVNFEEFEIHRAPFTQTVTMQINASRTRGLGIRKRHQIAGWVREAFSSLPSHAGITVEATHFLSGEPGSGTGIYWAKQNQMKEKLDKLVVAAELPVFRKAIEEYGAKTGTKIDFVDFPPQSLSFDVQIISTGNHAGRQVFLQDFLTFALNKSLLGNSELTYQSLEKISNFSASTIPPDNKTLQSFEQATYKEATIVPIGRRHVLAFSRQGLPVKLEFSDEIEFRFIPQN